MQNLLEVVRESLFYLFIALIVSSIIAPFIIDMLYKLKLTVRHVLNKDKKNKEFVSIHGWKSGTPNMGGLIILTVVPLLMLIVSPKTFEFNILLGGFIGLGIYGFIDNLLVDISKFNNELRQLQDAFLFRVLKMILMFVIGGAVGYLLHSNSADFSVLNFDGFDLELGIWVVPFFSLFMAFAVYAFDIFDGADGLFSGTFIVNFIGMILLLIVQGQFTFIPFLFIVMGTLIVFLYFNIPPARVWMGACGAMPVGFTLFYVAFLTDNLVPFVIMTLMQWVVLASSFIQIVAIRYFKKKVFKIAPLHHHFEAIGWPEYKVVMRFWLFSLVATLLGILVGTWI